MGQHIAKAGLLSLFSILLVACSDLLYSNIKCPDFKNSSRNNLKISYLTNKAKFHKSRTDHAKNPDNKQISRPEQEHLHKLPILFASLHSESAYEKDIFTISPSIYIEQIDSPPVDFQNHDTVQVSRDTPNTSSDSMIIYVRHGVIYLGDPEIKKLRDFASITALLVPPPLSFIVSIPTWIYYSIKHRKLYKRPVPRPVVFWYWFYLYYGTFAWLGAFLIIYGWYLLAKWFGSLF